MECRECGGKTEVTHNRKYKEYIRRRRVCKECGHAMTTYETFDPPRNLQPVVRKPYVRKTNKCRYNDGVICEGTTGCEACGWRPKQEE